MNFDEFATFVKGAVEDLSHHFKEPDEDFLPFAFIEGRKEAHILALDTNFFNSPERKRILFSTILPEIYRKVDGEIFAVVISVWLIKRPLLSTAPIERPSIAPDRIECVLVFCVSADNEAVYTAAINRFPDSPPILSQWNNDPFVEQYGMLDDMRDLVHSPKSER